MKLVSGGQGRSDESVEHSAKVWFLMFLLAAAMAFGAIVGCAADAKGTLKNNVIGSGAKK